MNAYLTAIKKMTKQQRRKVAKNTLRAIRFNTIAYHRELMGIVRGYLMALEEMGIINKEERYAVYDRARHLLLRYKNHTA